MRKCPKCSLEVAADSRICRVCGAILEEVVAAAPEQPEFADEEATSPLPGELETASPFDPPPGLTDVTSRPWTCVKCGEQIEANFDLCWNCGTSRDGTEDPEFAHVKDVDPPEPASGQLNPTDSGEPDSGGPERWCPRCGSRKIVPDVVIADRDDLSDGRLKAWVAGNPAAIIFRNHMSVEIRGDVCGQCGHLELRVENHEDLYDHFRSMRK